MTNPETLCVKIISSVDGYDRSVYLLLFGMKLDSFITPLSASNFAKFHHGARSLPLLLKLSGTPWHTKCWDSGLSEIISTSVLTTLVVK